MKKGPFRSFFDRLPDVPHYVPELTSVFADDEAEVIRTFVGEHLLPSADELDPPVWQRHNT